MDARFGRRDEEMMHTKTKTRVIETWAKLRWGEKSRENTEGRREGERERRRERGEEREEKRERRREGRNEKFRITLTAHYAD